MESDEDLNEEQRQLQHQKVYADDATVIKRQQQAMMFEKYLDESGLSLSFQIIFTEIIQKQIPEDQVFPYTATRLRQIGKELESIDSKAQNM